MIDPDTPWREYAECVTTDPDVFFHESRSELEREKHLKVARAVCDRCPVADRCLEDALINDERYGVFAGTTPEQRQVMRRARGLEPSSVAEGRELVAKYDRQIRYQGNAVELARSLGVSTEAVWQRVKRARRTLARLDGAA